MLSRNELNRYNRHIIMPEIGLKGQEMLKSAKVMVIGAGGLGSPVLLYLAAAGIGKIGIVDFDVVDESNLQRQILYSNEDIGRLKVNIAKEKLLKLNPFSEVEIYPFIINKSNALRLMSDYDLFVDCSDNFSTRFLVSDACAILNKPMVFGAIYKFEGQVSVFNYKNGPTYRCLIPEQPKNDDVPTCSQSGVIGVIPGIIGTMQAAEVIKIITGTGEVLSGKLFIFDALTFNSNIIEFEKSGIEINELVEYEEVCPDYRNVNEIDVIELDKLIKSKQDIQLIDIRKESDFKQFNLGGVNIPSEIIYQNIGMIEKEKMVVICCYVGYKSKDIISHLNENHGFTNLYNLSGGVNSWQALIVMQNNNGKNQ